jgi:hypothetical protein
MPDAKKKPCRICRRWFRPDVRVGSRQHTCNRPECQVARRKRTQANWCARNLDYFTARRIQARDRGERTPEPLRLPSPLASLPWDIAQTELGPKGADFVGIMGALLLRATKDQFKGQVVDKSTDPGTLPPDSAQDQFVAQIIDSA